MKLSKKIGKKTLSIFLAVLMIISVLPVSVFATGINNTTKSAETSEDITLFKDAFEVEELREEKVNLLVWNAR